MSDRHVRLYSYFSSVLHLITLLCKSKFWTCYIVEYGTRMVVLYTGVWLHVNLEWYNACYIELSLYCFNASWSLASCLKCFSLLFCLCWCGFPAYLLVLYCFLAFTGVVFLLIYLFFFLHWIAPPLVACSLRIHSMEGSKCLLHLNN